LSEIDPLISTWFCSSPRPGVSWPFSTSIFAASIALPFTVP